MKRIIWCLVFVLLINSAYGIGIAPAKSLSEFQPGSVIEKQFRVTVDEVPAKILLSTEGELGQYIELQETSIVTDSYEVTINYKIVMPERLNPGKRIGKILAIQVPTEFDDNKEKVIIATTAVLHQVWVEVPYPGKYAEAKLYVTGTEPVSFTIGLKNFGAEDINNAKAFCTIKGPTNEELATFKTNEITLKARTEGKLAASWKPENVGTYFIECAVNYDGTIIELKEVFEVGSMDLEILGLEVDTFKIGQIAKLDLELRNKWNQDIHAEGEMEIYKDNSQITSVQAIPVDIQTKSTETMSAYWDTNGIDVGNYDILAKIKYQGKQVQKLFNTVVSIDSISMKDSISGQVTEKDEGSRVSLLITAVIILIMMNITFFFYIRKKLSKNK